MSVYYHDKASVDEYIKMAEGHNGRGLINRLRKYLPEGSSMLELGTGPGTDWEIMSESYKVIGSDYSKEFLERLISKYSSSTFLELDASTLDTDKMYDGIYSNKVLHHLSDEQLRESIKRQGEILNPNGIICHSFWKGEGSEEFKGMYVNYHTELELTQLFQEKFEILEMELYPEFEEGDSILLIGRKLK